MGKNPILLHLELWDAHAYLRTDLVLCLISLNHYYFYLDYQLFAFDLLIFVLSYFVVKVGRDVIVFLNDK